MTISLGQSVRFRSYEETDGGVACYEELIGKVIGIDVPCRIAFSLLGTEVQTNDGVIHHISQEDIYPLGKV
jgi:hypothetical protein